MVTSEVAVMGWRISSSNCSSSKCSSSKCSSINRLISSSSISRADEAAGVGGGVVI